MLFCVSVGLILMGLKAFANRGKMGGKFLFIKPYCI